MKLPDLAKIGSSGLVQRLEFQQLLPSTNDHASMLAAEPFLACPALVLATEQTAGRGRGGNRWWSTPGGLMFSLVLQGSQPAANPAHWSGYSLAAGLAIAEALSFACSSADFTVKWPNDVYANGRKIAGILIEAPAQACGRLIVGIGLNVNNSFRAAPYELQEIATSLSDLANQPFDLTDVLLCVLERLSQRWAQLQEQGLAAIRADWEARSFLSGRTATLLAGPQQFVGRCLGIDDKGNLILQTESGRQAFAAGSVIDFE